MKKTLLIIISILMLFVLVACNNNADDTVQDTDSEKTDVNTEQPNTEQTQQPDDDSDNTENEPEVFPANTLLCGIDISGMSEEDAYNAVYERVNNYSLNLTVNGKTIVLTSADIELVCSETEVSAVLKALLNGESVDTAGIFTCNSDLIGSAISESLNINAQNTTIKYNSSKDEFYLTSSKTGQRVDAAAVLPEIVSAVFALNDSVEVRTAVTTLQPTLTEDSDKAKAALNKANEYLKISLAYTYTPDGGSTSTETLSKDTIAGFLYFDSNLNVKISSSKVESYVLTMHSKHSVNGATGKFVTSYGTTINLNVTYAGQPVDSKALYNDIYNCVSNKVSGTRKAPYEAKTGAGDMSFGGNYVEVNLSAQHLWVYKNGECVVSTPIVSGCVYNRWNTPTGVYSVNNKAQGIYLTGSNYVSWVDYWVAFIGRSYGLHDASWRDEFGGDIYLYDGSHGCVNIPPSIMASVYHNVSIGTKVIIYGGASNAAPVQQSISGTAEYNVASDAADFKLDAKLLYDVADLTYSSDNTSVAVVSPDGTVTVKGAGTATITVFAAASSYYTAAEMTVKITVYSACDEGRHTYEEWVQTKAPTCTEGEETSTCVLCGNIGTRPIPAVEEHTHGDAVVTDSTCASEGVSIVNCTKCGTEISRTVIAKKEHIFNGGEYCENGCGAANPGYVPSAPEGDGGGAEDTTTPPDSEA